MTNMSNGSPALSCVLLSYIPAIHSQSNTRHRRRIIACKIHRTSSNIRRIQPIAPGRRFQERRCSCIVQVARHSALDQTWTESIRYNTITRVVQSNLLGQVDRSGFGCVVRTLLKCQSCMLC